MKNIIDVLKQKESELEKLHRELSALFLVLPLLAEPNDPEIILPKKEITFP
jgi:hypothetical protein